MLGISFFSFQISPFNKKNDTNLDILRIKKNSKIAVLIITLIIVSISLFILLSYTRHSDSKSPGIISLYSVYKRSNVHFSPQFGIFIGVSFSSPDFL